MEILLELNSFWLVSWFSYSPVKAGFTPIGFQLVEIPVVCFSIGMIISHRK